MSDAVLTYAETRETLDLIMDRTAQAHTAGRTLEVLTVDNHADGPYLWMWSQKHRPELARRIEHMIRANRAQSTGQNGMLVGLDVDGGILLFRRLPQGL